MASAVDSFVHGPLEQARSRALRALWLSAHALWQQAHDEAQKGTDADCAWVHALLHREEGDSFNAAYWYRRAGKPAFQGTVQQEREEMIAALL